MLEPSTSLRPRRHKPVGSFWAPGPSKTFVPVNHSSALFCDLYPSFRAACKDTGCSKQDLGAWCGCGDVGHPPARCPGHTQLPAGSPRLLACLPWAHSVLEKTFSSEEWNFLFPTIPPPQTLCPVTTTVRHQGAELPALCRSPGQLCSLLAETLGRLSCGRLAERRAEWS